MKLYEFIEELESGEAITNKELISENVVLKSVFVDDEGLTVLCYVDLYEDEGDEVPAAFDIEDFKRDDWELFVAEEKELDI
jgi:hypothetical protein